MYGLMFEVVHRTLAEERQPSLDTIHTGTQGQIAEQHQVECDSATDAAAAQGGGVPLLAYNSPDLPAAVHVDNFAHLRSALERLPRLGRT